MPKYASNMHPSHHHDLRKLINRRPMLLLILLAKDHNTLNLLAKPAPDCIILLDLIIDEIPAPFTDECSDVLGITVGQTAPMATNVDTGQAYLAEDDGVLFTGVLELAEAAVAFYLVEFEVV